MRFYVYFDAYGQVREVLDEGQLAHQYGGDPDEFLKAMSSPSTGSGLGPVTGHVGTFSVETEEELKVYLESLGDEITEFYYCREETRPYNF
jgi:hypothetical protein